MKYILATDSFKGCMSSLEVEDEIAEVLNAKGIETVCLPMSDGGDGMLSAFTTATGGTLEPVYIHDLMMRRTDAHYGVTPDGTAIVEVAQACGLSLIKEEERNPMRAPHTAWANCSREPSSADAANSSSDSAAPPRAMLASE